MLNGLLRESLNDNGLVALGVQKLVVDDLDGRVVGREGRDLVGNGCSVGEGGDVFTDASEAQDEVFAVRTAQLGLALLAQHNEIGIRLLQEHLPGGPRHAGMDAATEALVGAADDDERFLALALQRLCLGVLENGVGGLAVGAGFGHRPLGTRELCGGDDFHRLCDFLNVADRLQTILDLAQGGV